MDAAHRHLVGDRQITVARAMREWERSAPARDVLLLDDLRTFRADVLRRHREHDHHGDGLHEDLVTLATRRDALRIFGAGSAAAILATLGASTAARAATPTGEVPSETAGPYPGDGSNSADVLEELAIVRHNIRRSVASSRTLAKGVPLRVNLTVTDAFNDYAPLAGRAVYHWHCDRSGRYSMYSSSIMEENYSADGAGGASGRAVSG